MKLKAMMPSLREKKRYLAFEIISDAQVPYQEARGAIGAGLERYLGVIGSAKAGIRMMKDMYDPRTGRGLLRVSNKHIEGARAAFTLIRTVAGKPAIVRSVGASGILKKAKTNYLQEV